MMEIEEYLVQKDKRLEKKVRRIKDHRVFDFNFIPDKPLMRDEVKPIVDALLRYEKTGIPNNQLVTGTRGSGKTVILRYLMSLMKGRKKLMFKYVNCRTHNTSFKILAETLGVKPRGSALSELWQRFQESHPGKCVIALDEVDLLSDKDRNKDILYMVSRSPQGYMAVLLSNNPRFLDQLDTSIRSSLQPEVVHFKNYSAPQIIEILKERARCGLGRIPNHTIAKIAALVAKNTNSDVRVAIKTLYYCSLEPDISLAEHFGKARRDIMVDVINDLNDKNLMILKAVVSDREKYVKSVYEAYKKLSRSIKEEPFSYVYFYSNLTYLQSLGLILLISTKIKRTYTNRIHPVFDQDLLKTIWKSRFL